MADSTDPSAEKPTEKQTDEAAEKRRLAIEKAMAERTVGAAELVAHYPYLRSPIVFGLLREAEIMNIVAATKTHKSWLSIDLAISVTSGTPWLGRFETKPSSVLLIDDELRPETLSYRLKEVMKAKQEVERKELSMDFAVSYVRGTQATIYDIDQTVFQAKKQGHRVDMIIIDALYKLMPFDADENSNSSVTLIYNEIERISSKYDAAVVVIHHTSKGNQNSKVITDVGSGAGSQSRAADTHLILRPHSLDGCVILESATRSWAPIDPLVLQWNFPLYHRTDLLPQCRSSSKVSYLSKITPAEFFSKYIPEKLTRRSQVAAQAMKDGFSASAIRQFIDAGIDEREIVETTKLGTGTTKWIKRIVRTEVPSE